MTEPGSRSLQSNRSPSLTPTLRGRSPSNTREDEKSPSPFEPPLIPDEYDESQDGIQSGIQDDKSLNDQGFGGDDFDDFEEGDVDDFGEFGEIDARGGRELPTSVPIQSIPVLSLVSISTEDVKYMATQSLSGLKLMYSSRC